MKTLTCPKCGTEIPLEEAVTHQIREELVLEFQARSAQREKAFVDREAKLFTLQTLLDESRETLDQEIERRVQAQADQLRTQARKQAETALELQIQDLRVELGEKEQKLAQNSASMNRGSKHWTSKSLGKWTKNVSKFAATQQQWQSKSNTCA